MSIGASKLAALGGRSGGKAISGADLGDRFIMGLLRASVDAVMVGARTVHDGWTTSGKTESI